jgi:putative flippase GtrA
MRRLVAQFARFGVVGAGGVVIDLVVFNVLRGTILHPDDIAHGPVVAKIISTSLAIIFNWLGNRYWTFRHTRRPHWLREAMEFAIVSLVGLGISLLCLYVSHYVLGFTDVLSDNIATNVVGLVLGTLFRFTFYRLWVFRGDRAPAREILGVEFPEEEIGTGSIPAVAATDSATARPSGSSRRVPPPATAGGAPPRG